MSSESFQAAYERVLTTLGIWKPGQTCMKPWILCPIQEYRRDPVLGTVIHHEHDIPPPELTDAVAWRILIAARKRAAKLYADGDVGAESKIVTALEGWIDFGAEDETAHTLILALAGAGQGAHERS